MQAIGKNPTSERSRFGLIETIILAVAYCAAGKLGLLLAFVNPNATAVWPPTGIALSALLLVGHRVWPGIWIGAFLANVTTFLATASPITAASAANILATTLGIATGNTLEAIMAARLVERFARGLNAFERPIDVLKFVAGAALLSTAMGATIGVTSLALGGFAQWNEVSAIWLTWWIGDMVSDLVIAPLLMLWGRRETTRVNRRLGFEFIALLLLLFLVGELIFGGWLPFKAKSYPLEYLAIPPLLWIAFRFGPKGAVVAAFVTSGLALWGTRSGFGPFAMADANQSLLLLQAFLGAITVTTLVLAAAVSENERFHKRLRVQYAVSQVLAESPTLGEASHKVLQAISETAGWEVGGIWRVDPASQTLRCVEIWHVPGLSIREFETASRSHNFPRGMGLPGRIWASGQPAWIRDVTRDSNFPRAPIAVKEGLHAAFGFPIRLGNEILGVIEFFNREIRKPDEELLQMMGAIGAQLGQFIERKHAEEELIYRKALLEAQSEASVDGILVVSREGKILTYNRRFAEMWALPPDVIESRSDEAALRAVESQLINPKGFYERVAHLYAHPEEHSHEEIALKGGRTIERYSSPVRTFDGGFYGRVWQFRDITERKRSEEELRHSESRYRTLAETSPVGIWQTTQNGRTLYINPALCAVFEVDDPEEMEGKTYRDFFTPDSVETVRREHAKRLAGVASSYEVEVIGKRGTRRNLIICGAPLFGPDGQVQSFIATLTDITAQKRALQALRSSEQRFQRLAENAPDIIARFDRKFRHLYVSPAIERASGLPAQAFLGKTSREAGLPDELCSFWEESISRVFESGQAQTMEFAFPSARGVRHYHSRLVPEFLGQTVETVLAVTRDITELKQYEAEIQKLNEDLESRVQERTSALQESNDQMEAFAYSISHDLRAPLRAMQGFAIALIEDYGPNLDDQGREYADRISASARRMETLIQDLLDYSRLGRIELRLTAVALDQIVDRVLLQMSPEIKEKRAEVKVRPPLPVVIANETLLEQVLTNLLSNALKFVADGVVPAIQIYAEEISGNTRLLIRDNGIGIAPDHHERIFRVFERLHGVETFPGTGIGLAIVRKGIERMRGRVGVESELGKGSCFWIELPKPTRIS